jgi:hypothetical protein
MCGVLDVWRLGFGVVCLAFDVKLFFKTEFSLVTKSYLLFFGIYFYWVH